MRNKLSKLLVFLILLYFKSNAQNIYGYSSCMNSGVNSVFVNPALSALQKKDFSLDLVGFNSYNISNKKVLNYSFLQNYGVDSLFLNLGQTSGFDGMNLAVILEARPIGLSLLIKNKFGVSISTRNRVFFNLNNFSQSLFNVLYNHVSFKDNNLGLNVRDAKFKLYDLNDIGINFSMPVWNRKKGQFLAGATVRRYGSESVVGMNVNNLHASVDTDYNVYSDRLDFYAYSGNNLGVMNSLVKKYSASDAIKISRIFRDLTLYPGKNKADGLGMDLGMIYIRKSEDFRKPYFYSLGMSLIDWGGVNYYSAQDLTINNNNILNFNLDTIQLSNIDVDSFVNSVNNLGYNGRYKHGITKRFSAPTTLNINADYSINSKFFVNFNSAICLTSKKTWAAQIPSTLIITPRFQSKYFDFTLPIGYNITYERATIGASIRVLFFYIGSNDLGTVLGNKSSTNIYMGFNLGFNNPKSKKKKIEKEKETIENNVG